MNFCDSINKYRKTTSICRLCLNYINNFTIHNRQTTHSMIMDCIPTINLGLTESPEICITCSLVLQQFHSFKELCINNETLIKSYYERNKSKLGSDNKISLTGVLEYQKELQNIEVELMDCKIRCGDTFNNDDSSDYQMDNAEDCLADNGAIIDNTEAILNMDMNNIPQKCKRKVKVSKKKPPNNTKIKEKQIKEGSSSVENKLDEFAQENQNYNLENDVLGSEVHRKNPPRIARNSTKLELIENETDNISTDNESDFNALGAVKTELGEVSDKDLSELDDDKDFSEEDIASNEDDDNFDDKNLLSRKNKKDTAKRKPRLKILSEYPCEICGKVFKTRKYFNRHMNGHNNRHLCALCGKSFTQKFFLNQHMNAHNNIKPYKCEFCFKAFTTSNDLKSHSFSHTDQKRFNCDQCPTGYNNRRSYTKHMAIHREEAIIAEGGVAPPRRFPCPHCPEQFHLKEDLQDHFVVHVEYKAYECETCGNQFVNQRKLRAHEKVHKGKHHICVTCGKGFNRNSQLVLHLKNVHSMTKESNLLLGMQ